MKTLSFTNLARAAVVLALLMLSALAAQTNAAAAPTWQAPVVLSQPDRVAAEVRLGFAASGSAIAVWQEQLEAPRPRQQWEPPADEVVRVRTRAASGAWSAPSALSEAGLVSELQLAVSPSARALAAWRRTAKTNSVVETALGLDGWVSSGDPTHTATPPGDFQVAMDELGNALALSVTSYPRTLRASYRPIFSSTWSAPVELDRSESIHGPAVAFDRSGHATAVWAAIDATKLWVVRAARRSSATGMWSAPVRLATMATSPGPPRVGVDTRGNVIAVWARRDDERQVVEATRRVADSEQWTPPVELSASSSFVTQPQIAVAPGGEAAVVWGRNDGTSLVVQATSYSPAAGWNTATNVSAPGRSALRAEVAVDPRGNAVAVWQRYDGNRDVVQASLRPAGLGQWLPPTDLGTGFAPTIALDRSGNGLAAWAAEQIHVASLVGSGPIVTELTVPSRARTGQRIAVATSATAWASPLAGSPRWDLGDGRVAAGHRATIEYATPGRYAVTAIHTDAAGTASRATAMIDVVPPAEPLLIVPGRGIGPLRLGMTPAAVTRLYGAPQSEHRARYPNRTFGRIARYPRAGGTLTVGYAGGSIVVLSTNSRSDRTSTRVGPGSPRTAAARLGGFHRSPAGYARHANGTITIFGARGRQTITHVAIARTGYAKP